MTQWQINDNLIWTRERRTLKFGANTRRVDVSDYDLGQGTVPTVIYNDLAQFTYGAAYTASHTFPIKLKERVANGDLDLYAMDSFKSWEKKPTHSSVYRPARPSVSFASQEAHSSRPYDVG